MSVALIGLSHKNGPVSMREGLASAGVAAILDRLAKREMEEAVVLSTCNRFEIYTSHQGRDAGELMAELTDCFSEWGGAPSEEFVYRHLDHAAVRHLFSVAAGLESLVVGEAEILGQVKQAYETARSLGRTGKLTNVLFQRALYVGKMVRTQTGISTGQSSVASVAVALAERIFGSLKNSSVLVLGAGAMAELAAKHLLSAKVSSIRVANRTWEKGAALAAQFGAEAVRWEDFPRQLETVDIVISSTGSPMPVITAEMVRASVRRGRSLFIIDIAMPRDVEESVQELDRVYLYTLDDLSGIVNENLSRRQAEITAARVLVDEKASEFWSWLRSASNGAQAGLRHSHPRKHQEAPTGSLDRPLSEK